MGCFNVTFEHINNVNVNISNNRHFTAKTEKIGKLYVQFGLICSVSYVNKLSISKDNLWLLPENMFKDSFVILSSVNWNIS